MEHQTKKRSFNIREQIIEEAVNCNVGFENADQFGACKADNAIMYILNENLDGTPFNKDFSNTFLDRLERYELILDETVKTASDEALANWIQSKFDPSEFFEGYDANNADDDDNDDNGVAYLKSLENTFNRLYKEKQSYLGLDLREAVIAANELKENLAVQIMDGLPEERVQGLEILKSLTLAEGFKIEEELDEKKAMSILSGNKDRLVQVKRYNKKKLGEYFAAKLKHAITLDYKNEIDEAAYLVKKYSNKGDPKKLREATELFESSIRNFEEYKHYDTAEGSKVLKSKLDDIEKELIEIEEILQDRLDIILTQGPIGPVKGGYTSEEIAIISKLLNETDEKSRKKRFADKNIEQQNKDVREIFKNILHIKKGNKLTDDDIEKAEKETGITYGGSETWNFWDISQRVWSEVTAEAAERFASEETTSEEKADRSRFELKKAGEWFAFKNDKMWWNRWLAEYFEIDDENRDGMVEQYKKLRSKIYTIVPNIEDFQGDRFHVTPAELELDVDFWDNALADIIEWVTEHSNLKLKNPEKLVTESLEDSDVSSRDISLSDEVIDIVRRYQGDDKESEIESIIDALRKML